MAGELKWNGEQAKAAIAAHVRRNISAACIALVNHLKEKLSVTGTGSAISTHTTRYGWGKKKTYRKGQRIYNFAPSAPGEAPRKQHGRLRGSVASEVAGLVGRVGTNLIYGRALELGTKNGKLKPRPWLLKGLYEMRSKLRAIISRPMH